MRRLLALLFLALPALGQVNVTTAPCKITDESCSRGVTSVPGGTTLAANVHTGTTFRATAPATVTITNATNATPIIVTAAAHGLVTGDAISISGITGNTNANGYFKITRLSADTFSLQNYSTGADIAGNGAYGGVPVAVTGIVQSNRVLVGDGTAAAPSLSFANFPSTGFVVTSGPAVNAYANGTVTFSTRATQSSIWGNRIELGGGPNVVFDVTTAATLQLGGANAASPVAQRLKVQDCTGSNCNGAATFTISAPAGRGTGTRGVIALEAPGVAASGDNAQTQATRLKIGELGVQWVTGTRPTCDASARGSVWYVAGGAGVADTFEVCGKAAADTYSWKAIVTF